MVAPAVFLAIVDENKLVKRAGSVLGCSLEGFRQKSVGQADIHQE